MYPSGYSSYGSGGVQAQSYGSFQGQGSGQLGGLSTGSQPVRQERKSQRITLADSNPLVDSARNERRSENPGFRSTNAPSNSPYGSFGAGPSNASNVAPQIASPYLTSPNPTEVGFGQQVAIDPATGARVERKSQTVIMSANTTLQAADSGTTYTRDAATGRLVERKSQTNTQFTPATEQRAQRKSQVYTIDPATGQMVEKKQDTLHPSISVTPSEQDGYAFNPVTGRLERKSQMQSSHADTAPKYPTSANSLGNTGFAQSPWGDDSKNERRSNQNTPAQQPSFAPSLGSQGPKRNPNPYGRAGRCCLKPSNANGGRRKNVSFQEGEASFVEFEKYLQKKVYQQISRPPAQGGQFQPLNAPQGGVQASSNYGLGVPGPRQMDRRSERNFDYNAPKAPYNVVRSSQFL